MKKILLIIPFFLILSVATPVFSQCPVLDEDIETMLSDEGYELADEYELNVQPDDYDYIYRDIYGGNEYLFLFVGEDGITDLDGYIYDDDGELIDKDAETDDGGFAGITYTCQNDERVKIKAKNYEAYCSDCYYCIKVYVYYRSQTTSTTLGSQAGQCPSPGDVFEKYLDNQGYELGDEYELNLDADDYDYVYRDIYGGNEYLFLFLGADGVTDLDGYVYDEDGGLIEKDAETGDGGIAVISYDCPKDERVKIKARNYESNCSECCIKILVYYR